MKFLVLNGSPKGDMSVTVQSMKYLELIQKDHSFEYVNVIQEVKQFEREPDKMVQFCKGMAAYDGVIWAFPLYHMTVHSEYKRFIELLFERKLESYFNNMAAGIFTTSIHFYDHTAHNYMWGIW